MPYKTCGLPAKKAWFLKTLLYAGWAPDPAASNVHDDILVLQKDRYKFIIKKHTTYEFTKPNGNARTKVVSFQWQNIKFDHREPYVIHIIHRRYIQFTVNLRRPADYTKGFAFDMAMVLRRCKKFLYDYAEKHGKFPVMSTFKTWIERNIYGHHEVAKAIYQEGHGTHWVGAKNYRPGKGFCGKQIVPVKEGKNIATTAATDDV